MFATNRFRHVQGALQTARSRASRPRTKRWLLAVAFAIFFILAVVSFRNLPEGVELRPLFMVAIALIGVPAIWLLNAFEYRSVAKADGHRVAFDNALQTSLAVSLANLLPAPGGVAVKTAALKLEGSSLGSALSVNAIAGIIWIGATTVLVGIALLTEPAFAARGAVIATVGVPILVGAALLLRRRGPGWRRAFVELLAIEAGTTLALAFRVALAFAAIGESASIVAAITIASAQVLAVAIGIFPAGLGLREALAAGLAVTVQVPAAVAVAASIVDRTSALAGRVLYVPVLGLHTRNVARRRVIDQGATATAPAELEPGTATRSGGMAAKSSTTRNSEQTED